jgi:hypothetical protein
MHNIDINAGCAIAQIGRRMSGSDSIWIVTRIRQSRTNATDLDWIHRHRYGCCRGSAHHHKLARYHLASSSATCCGTATTYVEIAEKAHDARFETRPGQVDDLGTQSRGAAFGRRRAGAFQDRGILQAHGPESAMSSLHRSSRVPTASGLVGPEGPRAARIATRGANRGARLSDLDNASFTPTLRSPRCRCCLLPPWAH